MRKPQETDRKEKKTFRGDKKERKEKRFRERRETGFQKFVSTSFFHIYKKSQN